MFDRYQKRWSKKHYYCWKGNTISMAEWFTKVAEKSNSSLSTLSPDRTNGLLKSCTVYTNCCNDIEKTWKTLLMLKHSQKQIVESNKGLVFITGVPGSGETTLAKQLVVQLFDEYDSFFLLRHYYPKHFMKYWIPHEKYISSWIKCILIAWTSILNWKRSLKLQ